MIEIVDFDSTLFDLLGFTTALPQAVGEEFDLDAGAFAAAIKDFYVRDIGYDVYAHLHASGVDLKTNHNEQRLLDRILSLHQQRTGEPDLLFADARDFLRRRLETPEIHIEILTVNLQSCFDFKRRLCGQALRHIPAQVVGLNKGVVLAEQWAQNLTYGGKTYDSARVIDDSPNQIEAVPNRDDIERIQVVRPAQKYRRTDQSGIRVVASLNEID